jgi:hypothetical protein
MGKSIASKMSIVFLCLYFLEPGNGFAAITSQSHVELYRGRPTLFINQEPVTVPLFNIFGGFGSDM